MDQQPTPPASPQLDLLVVHWFTEDALHRLVAAFPASDPRFRLIVVDNGSDPRRFPVLPPGSILIRPGTNLGFAAGNNAAFRSSTAPFVLLLNPDARPLHGALEELLRCFSETSEASEASIRADGFECSAFVPRLVSPGGAGQQSWQLKRLPKLRHLFAQALFLPVRGAMARHDRDLPAGTLIEQPAAAAIALARSVYERLGGFDEGFFPAWHEDVDLAMRARSAGVAFRYAPSATFEHEMGATVALLGYGEFLWHYDHNLTRFVHKHHGATSAWLLRFLIVPAALLRIVLLPLRRPRRARSRGEAVVGLTAVILGALTDWRRPSILAAGARANPSPNGAAP